MLDWDHVLRRSHLSMLDYGAKVLKQFQHEVPTVGQHQLFLSASIKYCTRKQYTTKQSTALLLDKKGKQFIQQVYGKFLFLG